MVVVLVDLDSGLCHWQLVTGPRSRSLVRVSGSCGYQRPTS